MSEIYNLDGAIESGEPAELPTQQTLEVLKFWYKLEGDPANTHDSSRLAEKFRDLAFRKKSIYRSHKRTVEKNPERPDAPDEVCYHVFVEPPRIGCAIHKLYLAKYQDPSEMIVDAFSFLTNGTKLYGFPIGVECQQFQESDGNLFIQIKLFFNLSK